MVIYPYECQCGTEFEIIKSMREIDNAEHCPNCQKAARRVIGLSNFGAISAGDWNKQSYNPAFGKVVNSKAHQREILAKFKGEGKEFIEIGNEKPESIHKHFDKQRADTAQKRWSEV